MTAVERRRRVVIAGHRGERAVVLEHLDDGDAGVREAALGALARLEALGDDRLIAAFVDPAATVRRRAASLAAGRPGVSLLPLLHDHDSTVVEVAAWACGEHEQVATVDKPNVRRRAVLALAPFDGDEVEAAIDRALIDRDWQVRQAAEDLRRATGEVDV
jgi:hypothetical protein